MQRPCIRAGIDTFKSSTLLKSIYIADFDRDSDRTIV